MCVSARPVEPTVARLVARNVLGREVVDITPKDFTELYLFVGSDGRGFVLLSADDRAFPLLGYSDEEQFLTEDMPCNLAAWIEGYQREIASLKAIGVSQSKAVEAEWQRLLTPNRKGRTKAENVQPLLQSRWNQPAPYNLRCPYDSINHAQSVTGCVATATAQVMRFWGHPAQGRGSHSYQWRDQTLAVNFDTSTYDWSNMPDVLRTTSSQVQKDAVAKLCYEVGMAADMNYSSTASGAYEHSGGMLKRFSAEQALENHFGYNPGSYACFKECYSDAEWDTLVRRELEAGHPIIYTGSSATGGHAFVVDGYSAYDDLFHVNWGWAGNNNGYFTISHLALGQEGQQGYTAFNELNGALFDVYPIVPNEEQSVVQLVSANPAQGTVSGSGTYAVSSDRVLLYASPRHGYRFNHWASGNYANPIFFFPTTDYADTAYFVALSADTLGYAHHFAPNFDTVISMAHSEWGIRIPADLLPASRELFEVQNFIYTTGTYHLRIYQEEMPTTPLVDTALELTSYGWRSIELATPLHIDTDSPLWITFMTEDVNYAASICSHSGIADASWMVKDGIWAPVDTSEYGYYTWCIRGLVRPATVGIDPAESATLTALVDGNTLTVTNPDHRNFGIYDAQGRLLQRSQADRLSLQLPAGVYLLRADGLSTRKIVMLK